MNMTAIDITDHKNVKQGEEVILLGAQGEVTTAPDIAEQLETIPYEVLCGVGALFPRRYVSSAVEPRVS